MSALDRAFIRAFAETGTVPVAASKSVAGDPARPAPKVVERPPQRELPSRTAPRELPSATSSKAAKAPATSGAAPAMAPLSTYTASTFTAAPPSAAPGHAMLEVERLVWPKFCSDLLERSEIGWSGFKAGLAADIAHGKKCIAITSCRRGEGRTTLALTIGKLLAMHGLQGVVADADFESPKLARMCGISAQLGWGEAIEADLPLGEALIASKADHLTLMPWRGSTALAAQVISSPQAATSLKQLTNHLDFIVVDWMPLDRSETIGQFAAHARLLGIDNVYFVRDVRWTTPEELNVAWDALVQAGIPLAGVIENFNNDEARGIEGEAIASGNVRPQVSR